MKVFFKKCREGAQIPTKGSEHAAGYDLYACLSQDVEIMPRETAVIPTGLCLELPSGYAGFVYARSGLATKKGLAPANKVGVCDSDYRGEYLVALYNQSGEVVTVKNGERIAQLVIAPYLDVEFVQEENLTKTGRGSGGFGSTGQ